MPHSYTFLPSTEVRDLTVRGSLRVDGAVLLPNKGRLQEETAPVAPGPPAPPTWWQRLLALFRG